MESAEKNSKTILSQRATAQVPLTQSMCYTVETNIPQIPVYSENFVAVSTQKGTHSEHVVVARLMLTDRKLREPLPADPTLNDIISSKLVL